MLVNRVLGKLRQMQAEYALDALINPNLKDAFEYGKHCGVEQGLRRAEQLILQEVEEEKRDQFE